jgi:hypothetical protein
MNFLFSIFYMYRESNDEIILTQLKTNKKNFPQDYKNLLRRKDLVKIIKREFYDKWLKQCEGVKL